MNHLKTGYHDTDRQSIEQFLHDFAEGHVPETPDLTESDQYAWLMPLLKGINDRRVINYAKRDQERLDWLAQTERLNQQLATASEMSHQLLVNAKDTIQFADFTAQKSREIHQRTRYLANNIEQMGDGIQDLARQTASSVGVVSKVKSLTQDTTEHMQNLASQNEAINGMIRVIERVADQTKMLALNATIEAARAGEAGRGFSVVAAEVKTLAKETADSVSLIQPKIQAIQMSTQQAVGYVQEIAQMMEPLNELSAGVAASVEEQAVISQEITLQAKETSQDSSDILQKMEAVVTNNQAATELVEKLELGHKEIVEFAHKLKASLQD